MKRLLQATKDTYITNRVIQDRFRATDANVGQAGTLDLFKLANESTFQTDGPFVSGTFNPIELSRILIKFDLNPLRALTSSILNLNDPSFLCQLKMSDVLGGQTLPSNFSLTLYPLAKTFDEGLGRDVYAFEDIDASNFITASISAGSAVTWTLSGAADPVSDYSGSVFVTQSFADGDEDLVMDITSIISSTLVGTLPDLGFRIAFSGTQETDDRSRFVKRFASRHSTNSRVRPKIEVGFNDSIQDHHENFFFDISGSLFLNTFIRGVPAFTGSSGLTVTLTTGSLVSGTYYAISASATQLREGIYSASFVIPSRATGSLFTEISNAHSATFTEVWSSIDGARGYHTGSIVVRDLERSAFNNTPDRLKVNITNMREAFRPSERIRFRVFAQDDGFKFKVGKLPVESKSIIVDSMHYRIRDVNSNEVIYDFDTTKNSTRMSTDSKGMYFDVYMSDLDVGRVYSFDVLIDIHGSRQVYESVGGSFRIDQNG